MTRKEYIAKFEANRSRLAGQFPAGSLLAVPLANPDNPSMVPVEIGARLLTEGTHRIASDTEYANFLAGHEMLRVRSPFVASLEDARAKFNALLTSKKGPKA